MQTQDASYPLTLPFDNANFFVFSKDLKEPYFHTILRAFLFTLPNISSSLTGKIISVYRSIHFPFGGGKEIRTPDLRLAKPSLSQLSYTPDSVHH